MSLTPDDVPRLPRGVRMRFDAVRNAHVLLAPERTFDLDRNAVAVLTLVDGTRSIRAIADALSQTYEADRSVIEPDVIVMLNGLREKRVLDAGSPQDPPPPA
ncbi:MAG: pyrroloquinoline quinone biosynthesis peptide chaperone PqqD [Methylobacterium frigidaeris]